MGRFNDKVVIITGAGDGLGRVMSVKFSAEGAKLVLAARRTEPLDETASLLDGECIVIPTDVTRESDIVAMVQQTVEHYGRVDILLNNAAQPGIDKYLWEQEAENWNNNLAVNLTGSMLCTREVLRQSMLGQKSGVIINFSTYGSWQGKPRKSHYSVSKAALRTLTKVTALEAGPFGIRANCVVPGATSTNLLVRYINRIAGEQGVSPDVIAERYRADSALRQINTPEQVADVALFLASEAAAGVTGQSIATDAGTVLVG